MKLEAVAPESFISERIEPEYLLPLLHKLTGIPLNDAIKIPVVSTGIGALAHDCEWQSTDARD